MDIEYLREYLVIADRLNLTQAAKELNTTQSTLSKHMAAIERDLGGEVLQRSKTGVKLTQVGVSFYRKAASIVSIYDEAVNEARKMRRHRKITVGGLISNGEVVSLLTRATEMLANQDSDQVMFIPVSGKSFFEQLRSGESDIVLCQGTENMGGSGITGQLLLRSRFLAIVQADHPLAGKDSISMDDLREYPLVQILDDAAVGGWGTIERVCQRHGFAPRKYPLILDRGVLDAFIEPINDAVFLLQQGAIPAGMLMSGTYRSVAITDEDAAFELCAYYRSQDVKKLSALLAVLEEAGRQLAETYSHAAESKVSRPFQTRCRKLAREHGLNETETAAMISFAKGRSIDRISQSMGLSRLMVGDTLAAVYQKLGLHDKQDLLDAIEAVQLP